MHWLLNGSGSQELKLKIWSDCPSYHLLVSVTDMPKTKFSGRFEGLIECAMINFTKYASKVVDYAVLTAIYWAIPGRTPTSISAECTSAARMALQGHTECITLLLNDELPSVQLELWVNGALLLLPFIPFNIIFCNIVKTADIDDLNSLKALVQAMELLSEKPDYSSCAKQLRIFQALYNVAARYVEVTGQEYFASRSGSASPDTGKVPNSSASIGPTAASLLMESSREYMESRSDMDSFVHNGGLGDGLEVLQNHTWAGLGGMELDPFGTQLGSWFHESNDVMDFHGGDE